MNEIMMAVWDRSVDFFLFSSLLKVFPDKSPITPKKNGKYDSFSIKFSVRT